MKLQEKVSQTSKKHLRSSLSTRLSSYVLLFFLLLLLLSVATYLITTRYTELTQNAFSNKQAIATLTAITVKEKIARVTDVGISLSTRVQFQKLVDSDQWEEAIKIMNAVPQSFPYINTVSLFTPQGTLEALTPSTPETHMAVGKNFSYRDYYQGVSKNWKPYVSEAFNRAAGPKYGFIAIAVPIKSPSDTRVIGILVLGVRLDTFVSWSKNLDVGVGGSINIVDQKGHLVSDPSVLPNGSVASYFSVPAVQRVLRGEHTTEVLFNPKKNETMLTSYEPLSDYGWGVVVEQPTKNAFIERSKSLQQNLILWTIFIIILETAVFLLLQNRATIKTQLDEKKALVDKIKKTLELVTSANKELEAFSYSVSHDLRAPLRAIDGFSKILLHDYAEKLDTEGKHIIETICSNTMQMGNLIDDLLAFSRLGNQETKRESIDMKELVQTIFDELKPVNSNRVIQFTCGDLPRVYGDATLLRQVWANLLSNALKFTKNKEVASISIGSLEGDETITYYIKDNGAGFDMKYVKKLFGVFQRLHSSQDFEGNGIGLSLVDRIIKKHNGKVWAEGIVDKGATFYFSLPR